MKISHHYGPKTIQLASNEAMVTCVVRNGEFYIEEFIEHYSRMGFRHIAFLDNGSSDQTISIATKHKNVSVYQSTLPIDAHQAYFKRYLAKNSANGGWRLDADIDEFFDYPFSDALGLRDFLDYLNKSQCTAVITQLLDMFSDKPLSCLAKTQREDLRGTYPYYDISEVTKTEYQTSEIVAKYAAANQLLNKAATLCWGGIRKTLWGNNCLLTKHSLFFPGRGLDLYPHIHFINNARVADVSGVMRHYKITSDALATALQNQERFVTNSKAYGRFIEFLANDSARGIKEKTAIKFRSVSDLRESGFVFTSTEYSEYVEAIVRGKAPCPESDARGFAMRAESPSAC